MGVKVSSLVIDLPTSTGTFDATITGFGTAIATLVIVTRSTGAAANAAVVSIGAATGASNEWAAFFEEENAASSSDAASGISTTRTILVRDGAGDSVLDGEAEFSSFITDGVRFNCTDAFASGYKAIVVLFGGSDLSAYAGTITTGTSLTLVDYTSIGFEADNVLLATGGPTNHMNVGLIHNNRAGTVVQRLASLYARQARPTMENHIYVSEAYCYVEQAPGSITTHGTASAFDSSGFSITYGGAAISNRTIGVLALRYGASAVVSSKVYTLSTPTSTGNSNDTGAGFEPQFVFYTGTLAESVDSQITDANAYSFLWAAATANSKAGSSISSEDNAADSNTQSQHDTGLVLPLNTGAAGMVASFDSWISTGVTWNWTDVETNAKKWIGWAIQVEATGVTVAPAASTAKGAKTDPTVVLGSVSISPSTRSAVTSRANPTIILGSITISPTSATAKVSKTEPTVEISSGPITPDFSAVKVVVAQPIVIYGSLFAQPPPNESKTSRTNPTIILGSVSVSLAACSAKTLAQIEAIVLSSQVVSPAARTLATAITQPTVVQSSQTVQPAAASVVAAKTEPVIVLGSVSVSPTANSAVVSRVNPTIIIGSISVSPAFSFAKTTIANPVIVLTSVSVSPTSSSVKTAKTDPTVQTGGDLVISPAAASSVTSRTNPAVVYGSISVSPSSISAKTASSISSAFYSEHLLPNEDIFMGAWVDQIDWQGNGLAMHLADIEDGTFAYHQTGTQDAYFEVGLENPAHPYMTAGDVILFWKIDRLDGIDENPITIQISLREGSGTEIAARQEQLSVSYSFKEKTYYLTAQEIALISNLSDLRLRFTIVTSGGVGTNPAILQAHIFIPLTEERDITVAPAASSVAANRANPTVLISDVFVSPVSATAKVTRQLGAVVLGSTTVSVGSSTVTASVEQPVVQVGAVLITPATASTKTAKADPVVVRGSLAIIPVSANVKTITSIENVEQSSLVITPISRSVKTATIAPITILGSVAFAPAAAAAKVSKAEPIIVLSSISFSPPATTAKTGTIVENVVQSSIVLGMTSVIVRTRALVGNVIVANYFYTRLLAAQYDDTMLLAEYEDSQFLAEYPSEASLQGIFESTR